MMMTISLWSWWWLNCQLVWPVSHEWWVSTSIINWQVEEANPTSWKTEWPSFQHLGSFNVKLGNFPLVQAVQNFWMLASKARTCSTEGMLEKRSDAGKSKSERSPKAQKMLKSEQTLGTTSLAQSRSRPPVFGSSWQFLQISSPLHPAPAGCLRAHPRFRKCKMRHDINIWIGDRW